MKVKQKSSPLHLRLLIVLLLDGPFNVTGAALKKMDVGVVLDTTSWIGNISWTCMQLAVEDFYNLHPDYITQLDLELRESGGDAFGATSAVVDLLKNVHVQAIIGPQKSTQAKFVIELGDKTHVPIISFSAKSPSLSSIQSSYFIRTALNDSTQAEVVASIIQRFKWKQVVPICEDSDYGAGFVPYLVDALQDSGARISYRSTIPLLATKQQIQEELSKLNNSQTRVFVVHMSHSLGLELFQIAKKMKMLGEGYVWIITYGLTDLLDLAGSSATSVMQGVIGLKPYVQETSKLNALKRRWKIKFDQSNPGSVVTKPTVFGLWAYDTVWSLALAAESIHTTNSTFLDQKIANSSSDLATLPISQNGPKFLSMIRSTSFDGMSGKFHLIDGQLEPQAFEIINVVKQGNRRIGFWTPTYGASRYIGSKAHLQVLEWPGESNKVPKGWEWPTMGNKLRVGVPVKTGFNRFVDLNEDPDIHSRGFCIQVFEEVINSLPYKVPIKYIPFINATGQPNGTYDDLVYQVYLQVFPRGSPLVPDVSRKILQVITKKRLMALENILYRNNTCPDKGDMVTTSSSLSFTSFSGLFLITGVTSLLAIFLHIVFFLYEHRDILRSQDVSENTIFQKLALLVKLYNEKGNASHATEEIDMDGPVTADIMASPDTISGMQSPSVMSSYTNSTLAPEDEFGSPLEGEGIPGREISAQNRDPPSFADMVM